MRHMLTVTQRLMSGLGQAGSDWAWSMSINDISYSPPQLTEEPEAKDKSHDNPSGTSDALSDLYVSDS